MKTKPTKLHKRPIFVLIGTFLFSIGLLFGIGSNFITYAATAPFDDPSSTDGRRIDGDFFN